MYSSDNTINDPNHKIAIDLSYVSTHTTIVPISQADYDMMGFHDPRTIYFITDSKLGDMYLGDTIIYKFQNKNEYLLALGDHTKSFIIYLNSISCHRDNLIPVAEFDDINDAIKALYQYKKVGTHTNLGSVICSIVESYMDDVYGVNEAIINMIAASGFRDDIRLQYLNEKAMSYGVSNKDKQLPQYYVAALHNLKDNEPDTTISIYSDLYDIFVKYDFMKEVDDDNISDVVYDLTTAMYSFVF